MFDSAAINELVLRKELLKTESDLNRQALSSQLTELRASLKTVDQVGHWARKAYPLLLLVAPVAGYLWSRRRPTGQGLGSMVMGLARLAGLLKPLWSRLRRMKATPHD